MLQPRLLIAFLSTWGLLTPWVAAQVAPSDPTPHDWMPAGSVRGTDAIAALGSDLDQVAAAHGMEAATLEAILRRDDTLWVDGQGRLFYADPALAPSAADAEQKSLPATENIAPGEAFTLHSRPGSTKTIYLDFTGHHSVDNFWGHDIVFPAYDTSGDPSVFSIAELSDIISWWRHVVEDYAPFDVDVTTEEPAMDILTRSSAGDEFYGVRCVVTQPTDGFPDEGLFGVAWVAYLGYPVNTPVFAFNKGINAGSRTASHEIGHAMHLTHDGILPGGYHPGTGSGPTSWGPIMGASTNMSLVQWSPGDYPDASNTEDDVMVITSVLNGVSFVPDDHGDAIAFATPLVPPIGAPAEVLGAADGQIGRREDVDVFTFVLPTPDEVIVRADLLKPGTNLDVRLDLLDAQEQLITTSNPAEAADASIIRVLPAGAYAVKLDGVGKPGTYSDYGSLGEYTLTVATASAAPPPHDVAVVEAYGTVASNDMSGAAGGVPIGAPTFLHLEANPTASIDDLPGQALYAIDFSATYMIVGDLVVPWKSGNAPDLYMNADEVADIQRLSADGGTTLPGVAGRFDVVASSLWGSTDLAQMQGLYPGAPFSYTDWALHYQDATSLLTLQIHLDSLSIAIEAVSPTWIDLGNGSGYATLEGAGPLEGGVPMQLAIDTPASTTAALVVGIQRIDLPFKGGVMVPSRNLVITGLPLTNGARVVGGKWPSGIPAGLSLYFQIWANDPTDLVSANLISSNAVEGIAH